MPAYHWQTQGADDARQVLQGVIKEHQLHGLVLGVVRSQQRLKQRLDGAIAAQILVQPWCSVCSVHTCQHILEVAKQDRVAECGLRQSRVPVFLLRPQPTQFPA